MKQFKRLLCLLLAAVALMSLLPGTAAAADDQTEEETAIVTIKKKIPSQTTTKYTVEVGSKKVKLKDPKYVTIKDKIYELSHYTIGKDKFWSVTIPAYDGTKDWEKEWGNTISVVYKRHYHSYKKAFDRIFHWDQCDCGYVGKKERHVDPALDSDKICVCDYHFSDNANLTTLWLTDVVPSVPFKPEITEYTCMPNTRTPTSSTANKTTNTTITVERILQTFLSHLGIDTFTNLSLHKIRTYGVIDQAENVLSRVFVVSNCTVKNLHGEIKHYVKNVVEQHPYVCFI